MPALGSCPHPPHRETTEPFDDGLYRVCGQCGQKRRALPRGKTKTENLLAVEERREATWQRRMEAAGVVVVD